MNFITRTLIASVDWAVLRTGSGSGAALPQAFDDLSRATSGPVANDVYWRIDNEVVVQGELYEASVPALEVLLSMASTSLPGPARRAVAELIQQITFGQPHSSEIDLGNADIADRCISLAVEAKWIFYGWLTDVDSDVQECALLTLCKTEANEERKGIIFAAYRDGNPTPGVEKILSQIERGLL